MGPGRAGFWGSGGSWFWGSGLGLKLELAAEELLKYAYLTSIMKNYRLIFGIIVLG